MNSKWGDVRDVLLGTLVAVLMVLMLGMAVLYIATANPQVERPSSAVGGMGMPDSRRGSSGGPVMKPHNSHNSTHNYRVEP